MITIKEGHINELKLSKLKAFRNDSVLSLKKNETAFCEEKDNDTLLNFIDDTINYASSSSIKRKNNIKRLMLLIIRHPSPLTPPQNDLLEDENLDEGYRVQKLAAFLEKRNGQTLVSVDTDLKAMNIHSTLTRGSNEA